MSGHVATAAGTGEMGRGGVKPGPGRERALRSPWDLAWDGERLFVAMAGTHQIWTFDPAGGELDLFCGNGHEVRRNGPAAEASFAQPSGLALLEWVLYVADSEISSIRAVAPLGPGARVRTVCGSGDLFGFGDRDGIGEEVLLQHPIGIAGGDGALFVADTFNHKVKRVDPHTGACTTLFGSSEPERLPELVPEYALEPASAASAAFFEPEGLAIYDRRLLVADTNNHRVLAVDLTSGERHVVIGGRAAHRRSTARGDFVSRPRLRPALDLAQVVEATSRGRRSFGAAAPSRLRSALHPGDAPPRPIYQSSIYRNPIERPTEPSTGARLPRPE
ncbi:MAG: hypothetical protein ACRDJ4_02190 [Actinomycetota bacterium]